MAMAMVARRALWLGWLLGGVFWLWFRCGLRICFGKVLWSGKLGHYGMRQKNEQKIEERTVLRRGGAEGFACRTPGSTDGFVHKDTSGGYADHHINLCTQNWMDNDGTGWIRTENAQLEGCQSSWLVEESSL